MTIRRLLAASAIAALALAAGAPAGSVSILPMTRELGDRMVADPRFKLLTFTGSPSVGWRMKEREHHGEDGALTEIALDLDTAFVQIRNPGTDREPETSTLLRVGSSDISSEEPMKNLLMIDRGNADAMVCDGKSRFLFVFHERDLNFPAGM